LNAAALPWKYYAPSIGQDGGNLWSAYDASSPIRYSKYWAGNVISPETRVLSDIQGGNLPAVTWVIPSFTDSDHPDSYSSGGPDWVGSVVNAVGNSKFWNSSAIFILWDDWGGWYDDVPPPQLDLVGLGFRVPFIVVSPYAKHDYVSHVQYEYGSIVKFAEWAFNLQSLGVTDVRANPLFDCFNFTQAPRPFQPLSLKRDARWFLAAPPDHRAPDED
jgi:phospholipase C